MREGVPTTIKRYGGCRFYNPTLARYVTLDDLAGLVANDEDFVVRDTATGENITSLILEQIIVERGNHG